MEAQIGSPRLGRNDTSYNKKISHQDVILNSVLRNIISLTLSTHRFMHCFTPNALQVTCSSISLEMGGYPVGGLGLPLTN